MALADGGVVLEAALGERDALILQVRDLCDAAAAEVAVLDGIVGELRFRRVNDDLAVLGLAVGDGDGHGLDAALVAAPAGARIVLGKHLVLGDGALAGHQALGDRAAVEEDDLVLVVAVVVVPVEHGRAFGSKAHGAHGDGGAHIDLAGRNDAAVVELESSTHGQMRRYVSISFQQRSARASDGILRCTRRATETFASVRALEAGTLEKSV